MLHGDRGLRADLDTRAGGTRRPSSAVRHDLPRTSLAQKLLPGPLGSSPRDPRTVCRLTTQRARVVGANWVRLPPWPPPPGRSRPGARPGARHVPREQRSRAQPYLRGTSRLQRAAPTALPGAGRATSLQVWPVGGRKPGCLHRCCPDNGPWARSPVRMAICSYSPVTCLSIPSTHLSLGLCPLLINIRNCCIWDNDHLWVRIVNVRTRILYHYLQYTPVLLCSCSVVQVDDFLTASAFPVFLRASGFLVTLVSRPVFSRQSCRAVSRTPVLHPSGKSPGWNAGVWLSFRTASAA